MKPETITITSILSADLKSRSAVSDLVLYINNSGNNSVVIDFCGVQFATRSFIDEFYNHFLKTPRDDFKVEIANMPADIQKVLDAVSRTQNKHIKARASGKVLKFKSVAEMNGFLQTIQL